MAYRASAWSASVVAFALVSTRAHAAESEKDRCIAAADQGQQLRDDNKYRLARDAFSRCARETCPSLVKQECGQWLHELDEKSPSVVLGAQDGKGSDLADVTVTMDGAPFVSTLDGKPAPIDPGDHVLHFEAAGLPAVEEHVTIRAGEKNRVINVKFGDGAPSPTSVETPPAGEAPPQSKMPPLATWVFGGLAVASFGSEAYFGLSGLNDRSTDLGPGGCAPNCTQSEKSSIQTKFVVADISLGVGIVSAGLATYFFLKSRGVATAVDAAVDFAPRPGGGVATVGGRF